MRDSLKDPYILVADAIGCETEKLSVSSEMYRDFGWDSLGHVNVLLALEDNYGVVLDEVNVEKYKKLSEILKLYELKKSEIHYG